jgi:hypothetical protein
MKIKYKGTESNIERYKDFVKTQEENLRQNSKFINYKDKNDGFRILHGELKIKTAHGQQSERPISGVHPDDKLYIDGMANANVEDRMNEIVNPSGCDVRSYVRNPILLSDHMYHSSYAIGIVEELRIEGDGVHFTAYIGDPSLGQLTDKQKEIRSLVAQKILKTVSIGFIPKEITVPEWDEETGKMISPAKIEKWEMLELSIVPVPANQDSVFDIKTLTNNKDFKENGTKAEGTVIQSLIFDKELFTAETAKKWALDHDFKAESVDETTDSIRLRQKDPNEFLEDSFRTIELTDGVKAVIGRLKDGNDMDEKTAQELVSGIKQMGTLLQTLSANSQRSIELTESLVKQFEEKAKPAMDDEKEDEEECACKPKKECEPTEVVPVEEPKVDEVEKKLNELDAKIERLAGFVKIMAERISE